MHKHRQIAAQFLSAWFAEDETFAIVVRRPEERRTIQRIICISDLLKSNYLGWLAFENSRGGNVYFSINPLTPGATRRTKDAVADAKGLYLDLDSEGDAKLATISHSESVPVPSAVIQTSTGKYQVLWRIHGFSVSEQEATLKSLAETFGGDRACTDCARVFRLPGFFNRKYNPACLVTVDTDARQTHYSPADFKLQTPGPKTGEPAPIRSKSPCGSGTRSESDWRCSRPGRFPPGQAEAVVLCAAHR
jgi:RepB DNA-primase from phage plasmid